MGRGSPAVRRRATVVAVFLLLVVLAVALAPSLRSGRSRPAAHPARGVHAARIGGRASASRRARREREHIAFTRSSPSPGSLPQTRAYPSGRSATFSLLMAALWSGVVRDSVSSALPAFFPRGAYEQLKAIPSAGSDWSGRLVHDYGLDIHAAHELLGRGAAEARLLRVTVPSSYGHWVPPGVCFNSIGYYEMPNARVVYSEHGSSRSFGIASMISWRGVWYVVHLGAVLRAADEGVVDEPAAGPGSSAYSGTC
jgi:hypothetical protein